VGDEAPLSWSVGELFEVSDFKVIGSPSWQGLVWFSWMAFSVSAALDYGRLVSWGAVKLKNSSGLLKEPYFNFSNRNLRVQKVFDNFADFLVL